MYYLHELSLKSLCMHLSVHVPTCALESPLGFLSSNTLSGLDPVGSVSHFNGL